MLQRGKINSIYSLICSQAYDKDNKSLILLKCDANEKATLCISSISRKTEGQIKSTLRPSPCLFNFLLLLFFNLPPRIYFPMLSDWGQGLSL